MAVDRFGLAMFYPAFNFHLASRPVLVELRVLPPPFLYTLLLTQIPLLVFVPTHLEFTCSRNPFGVGAVIAKSFMFV